MDRLLIKVYSALVGIFGLLGLMAFYSMKKGQLVDLTSSIFWYGYVGLIISMTCGIALSFFVEWLIKQPERSGVGDNITFIWYHTLAGTLIPILGNIVAFFFAVTHLLIENGKTKEVLFFCIWMVSLIFTGFFLQINGTDYFNIQLGDMTPFFVLITIGVGFSAYLLLSGNVMLRIMIFLISICSIFLPSTLNILQAHEEAHTSDRPYSELEFVHNHLKNRYSNLKLDIASSNDSEKLLHLTIHKNTIGFSIPQMEKLIKDTSVSESEFSLRLYEEEKDFLDITVDSARKVTECESSNPKKNICSVLLSN
ncbi:hypothetical protein ABE65_019200 [Fictibacillus phosphorivorans]|uniref:Uncharacterized protein n=1 Tax=Fictibacillus phosphorivorans TaxID=1221500 RepID=A0A160IQQ6_9BACL|nr:hypothetical protein [Fictibacillus phosphorivorans]ANC78808.1 hypothetical protein ABE65_019200 [Fictibacillus phosphorivorans]